MRRLIDSQWGRLLVAVALIAALTALAVPVAARGEPMKAGMVNGARGYMTSLYSTNPNAALRLVNNRPAGEPALDLQVGWGDPPLSVNSNAWIQRLNTDKVDGYDVNDLFRAGGCGNGTIGDGSVYSYWECSFTIWAPVAGTIAMTGSIELWRTDNDGGDDVNCRFYVDDVLARWSRRDVHLGPLMSDKNDENCATETFVDVDPGVHTITFQVRELGLRTNYRWAAAFGYFTPFQG
jgi:hypothetical protein